MCSTIVITKLVTNLFESQTLTFHIRRSLVTILVETCLGRFLVSRQEIVCELTILWAFTVGGGKTSNHDVAGRQTEPTSLLQIDEIKYVCRCHGFQVLSSVCLRFAFFNTFLNIRNTPDAQDPDLLDECHPGKEKTWRFRGDKSLRYTAFQFGVKRLKQIQASTLFVQVVVAVIFGGINRDLCQDIFFGEQIWLFNDTFHLIRVRGIR